MVADTLAAVLQCEEHTSWACALSFAKMMLCFASTRQILYLFVQSHLQCLHLIH